MAERDVDTKCIFSNTYAITANENEMRRQPQCFSICNGSYNNNSWKAKHISLCPLENQQQEKKATTGTTATTTRVTNREELSKWTEYSSPLNKGEMVGERERETGACTCVCVCVCFGSSSSFAVSQLMRRSFAVLIALERVPPTSHLVIKQKWKQKPAPNDNNDDNDDHHDDDRGCCCCCCYCWWYNLTIFSQSQSQPQSLSLRSQISVCFFAPNFVAALSFGRLWMFSAELVLPAHKYTNVQTQAQIRTQPETQAPAHTRIHIHIHMHMHMHIRWE